MPFQVSPGVNVTEVDLTTVIPAVSTSIGATVGRFAWGPVEQATLVSSEINLVTQYGKPSANSLIDGADWFSAANFLSYSNALRVVRATSATTVNADESGLTNVLIKNDTTFEAANPTANTFYAKYAGDRGNEITVAYCDNPGTVAAGAAGGGFENWAPNTYFSDAPGTSPYAAARGSANDELHVIVLDSATGALSGVPNAALEIYPFLSKASDAKSDSNETIYFKDAINRDSAYIRIGSPTANTQTDYGKEVIDGGAAVTFGNTTPGQHSFPLLGGVDGEPTTGDYQIGWDLFADTDQEDVSLLIAGTGGGNLSDADQATTVNYVIDLATTRKDCVAFYSPQKSDTSVASDASKLTNVKGFRTSVTNKNTSYAFLDSGWKYQYDKYNDVYRWIPLNGDIAGLAARTDNQRDAWWSPAGYNRGQIKNVVKLAFNPAKAARDSLYQKQVNPVVTFPGQGTMLFGDKTSLTRPSAFDRINVRRLFIVLEKAIATAAKFSLFEFNDSFTRSQFRNMVEPFLRDVKGRRGINEFRVVCDETNNPGSVIDRNEFVGDIYIKPVRSINFIQLNFIAVQTGVNFSEVVGKF